MLQINLKKEQIHGRKSEERKRLKLSGHKSGSNCNCSRLKCFEKVAESERSRIIAHFNGLRSKAEQDSVLSNLIDILPVKRRRSRKKDNNGLLHDFSYQYYVNTLDDGKYSRINVCIDAFCSIFGSTRGRVRFVRESIATSGRFGETSHWRRSLKTIHILQ